MKRIFRVFFLCIFCVVFFAVSLSVLAKSDKNYVDDEVIVKFKKDKVNLRKLSNKEQQDLADGLMKNIKNNAGVERKLLDKIDKLKVDKVNEGYNLELLKVGDGTVSDVVELLKKDGVVEYAEPNYKRKIEASPNDPKFTDGTAWHLNDLSNGYDVNAKGAWDIEQNSGDDVIVAVLDTGINYNHEDLAANMWDGTTCKDVNGSTTTCPNHGWDFYAYDNDPMDAGYHGTMVAGFIGAVANNSKGSSGMSYYNHIKLMAIRIGQDYISTWSIIDGIKFAENNGAKIINASYGGDGYSQAEKDAMDAFSGIFMVASGNDGEDITSVGFYPCKYYLDNIICVGATDRNNNLASYSNYSNVYVDILAPGSSVYSTYYSSYNSGSGTSYATPVMSGIGAVLFSRYGSALSNWSAREILINYGDSIASANGKTVSGKKTNFYKVLSFENEIKLPVYRFYSDFYGNHFFTVDSMEREYLMANRSNVWGLEGIGWYAYVKSSAGVKPVYRFYSDFYGEHFYTMSESEKDYLVNNRSNVWKYEGIGWYAREAATSGAVPVYRFYSDFYGEHFFTISESEKDYLVNNRSNVWKLEGVGWYAYTSL